MIICSSEIFLRDHWNYNIISNLRLFNESFNVWHISQFVFMLSVIKILWIINLDVDYYSCYYPYSIQIEYLCNILN